MSDRKLLTGIESLDSLFGGGIPVKTAFLVYGPPFVGKDAFIKKFSDECLRHSIPVIFVLTNVTSVQMREEMLRTDNEYTRYEENGLVRYVDAYSRAIGSKENDRYTEYTPASVDLTAINLAIGRAQQTVKEKHAYHLIILDSLTTLIANTNLAVVFRFVNILKGRVKMAGSIPLFVMAMGAGVHPEPEVQLFKGVMDGVVEFKEDAKNSKLYLRLQGFGDVKTRDWVEYRFERGKIDVMRAGGGE